MHTQFMDAMKAALLRFRQLKQLLAGVMLGLLALSTLQAHARRQAQYVQLVGLHQRQHGAEF